MKLAALLGYDGPMKVWVDGKLKFHDPEGIEPAPCRARRRSKFTAGRGRHEVLIALGSNRGAAWGICLAFERLELRRR